jgi:uncharacterized repeat protein (TIGR01451 family)
VTGSATNGATVTGSALNWSGPLAAGATTTVTYQVKVNGPDTGDHVLRNTVTAGGNGGRCLTAADCTTSTPVASFTTAKSSSPSGTVHVGNTVTYTVTVTNTGAVDYTAAKPASFIDDLSKVTDDATYNNDASSDAAVTGNTLSWSGALATGGTTTVTYSVTVNAPDTGDRTLTNVVVPTGRSGSCVTAADCTTTNPVGSYPIAQLPLTGGVGTDGVLMGGASITMLALVMAILRGLAIRRRRNRLTTDTSTAHGRP